MNKGTSNISPMRAQFLLLFSSLLIVFNTAAQDWQELQTDDLRFVFGELSQKMRKPDTRFTYIREVYRHFSDEKPLSVSEGVIILGKDGQYRAESDGELLIQNGKVKMIVDTLNHKVMILGTDTLFKSIDPEQLLNGASLNDFTYRKRISEKQAIYQINPLDPRVSQSMEIHLDENGDLRRLELFMPEGNYFSESMEDETTELPKVVLVLDKPVSCFPDKDGSLDISPWVILTKGFYQLTPVYSVTYQLDDLRYKPQH